jgi:F0F1-type ATP synthase membrane subunit b/b'
MIRAQIQLTEEQARALREQASREGRSIASLVRESVSEYLVRHRAVDREALRRSALELAGAFRSGAPDLSVEHDRHLAEALGDHRSSEA